MENNQSEAICVAIRMRPLNDREMSNNQEKIFKCTSNQTIAQIKDNQIVESQSFYYDKVFDETASTKEIHDSVTKEIVQGAVKGLNGTIFAYGQTSSGKTFTMLGSNDQKGIIEFSAADIFESISKHPERDFLIRVSFVEIYNEIIRDLLSDSIDSVVNIREDPRKGVYCEATEIFINDYNSLISALKKGSGRRVVETTAMNDTSSRSHSIFKIVVESKLSDRTGIDNEGAVLVASLNLVDLAGSESVRHTGATGQRAKEGGKINVSLLTLSRVIQALSVPGAHVNFRDSKLTRLLQPSLSGNAKMAVICCITPSEKYLEETRSTLQFASRAKLVSTQARVNEVVDEVTQIKRLKREVEEWKSLYNTIASADNKESESHLKNNELLEKIQSLENEKEHDKEMIAQYRNELNLLDHAVFLKKPNKKIKRDSWVFTGDDDELVNNVTVVSQEDIKLKIENYENVIHDLKVKFNLENQMNAIIESELTEAKVQLDNASNQKKLLANEIIEMKNNYEFQLASVSEDLSICLSNLSSHKQKISNLECNYNELINQFNEVNDNNIYLSNEIKKYQHNYIKIEEVETIQNNLNSQINELKNQLEKYQSSQSNSEFLIESCEKINTKSQLPLIEEALQPSNDLQQHQIDELLCQLSIYKSNYVCIDVVEKDKESFELIRRSQEHEISDLKKQLTEFDENHIAITVHQNQIADLNKKFLDYKNDFISKDEYENMRLTLESQVSNLVLKLHEFEDNYVSLDDLNKFEIELKEKHEKVCYNYEEEIKNLRSSCDLNCLLKQDLEKSQEILHNQIQMLVNQLNSYREEQTLFEEFKNDSYKIQEELIAKNEDLSKKLLFYETDYLPNQEVKLMQKGYIEKIDDLSEKLSLFQSGFIPIEQIELLKKDSQNIQENLNNKIKEFTNMVSNYESNYTANTDVEILCQNYESQITNLSNELISKMNEYQEKYISKEFYEESIKNFQDKLNEKSNGLFNITNDYKSNYIAISEFEIMKQNYEFQILNLSTEFKNKLSEYQENYISKESSKVIEDKLNEKINELSEVICNYENSIDTIKQDYESQIVIIKNELNCLTHEDRENYIPKEDYEKSKIDLQERINELSTMLLNYESNYIPNAEVEVIKQTFELQISNLSEDLKNQLNEYKNNYISKEDYEESIRNTQDILNEKVNELTEKILFYESEIQILKRSYEYQVLNLSNELLSKENNDFLLREKIIELHKNMETLESNRLEQLEKNTQLENDIASYREKLSKQCSREQELLDSIKTADDELAKNKLTFHNSQIIYEEKLNALLENISIYQSGFVSIEEVEKLTEESKSIHDKLNEQIKELSNLVSNYQSHYVANDDMEIIKQNYESQIKSLLDELLTKESSFGENNNQLQQKINDLLVSIDKMDSIRLEQEEKITQLENELAMYHKEISESHSREEELVNAIQEADNELCNNKITIEELMISKDQIKELEKQLESLLDDVSHHKNENKHLKKSLLQLQIEKDSFANNYENMKLEILQFQNQNQNLIVESQGLKDSIQQLKRDNDKLSVSAKEKLKDYIKISNENENLHLEIDKFSSELQELKNQLSECDKLIEVKDKRISQLEISKLTKEQIEKIKILKVNKNKLEVENRQLKEQLLKYESMVDSSLNMKSISGKENPKSSSYLESMIDTKVEIKSHSKHEYEKQLKMVEILKDKLKDCSKQLQEYEDERKFIIEVLVDNNVDPNELFLKNLDSSDLSVHSDQSSVSANSNMSNYLAVNLVEGIKVMINNIKSDNLITINKYTDKIKVLENKIKLLDNNKSSNQVNQLNEQISILQLDKQKLQEQCLELTNQLTSLTKEYELLQEENVELLQDIKQLKLSKRTPLVDISHVKGQNKNTSNTDSNVEVKSTNDTLINETIVKSSNIIDNKLDRQDDTENILPSNKRIRMKVGMNNYDTTTKSNQDDIDTPTECKQS